MKRKRGREGASVVIFITLSAQISFKRKFFVFDLASQCVWTEVYLMQTQQVENNQVLNDFVKIQVHIVFIFGLLVSGTHCNNTYTLSYKLICYLQCEEEE